MIITQKTIESRKKSDEIIGQRFAKGYVSQLDKVQVEQQVAIAEGTLQQVLRRITFLENSLYKNNYPNIGYCKALGFKVD